MSDNFTANGAPKLDELPLNYTLQYLHALGLPRTVSAYVSLNWWDRSLESLEGEDLVEVLKLVEDGLLTPTPEEQKYLEQFYPEAE